jgi:hypothetical protein
MTLTDAVRTRLLAIACQAQTAGPLHNPCQCKSGK